MRAGLAAALALCLLLGARPAAAVYQCGDQKDDCQCGANNPYPCCDNGGNCTWYAWEAACCAWGVGLPGWGNANQWSGNAAANASYQVLPNPVVDAVSCRASGQYGHMAFVTAVSGSSITVHEENCWGNYGMDTASYQASYFTGGFIVRAGQVACSPGDTQAQSCGNCGTQSRGCTSAGTWDAWGACSDEGACAPGATDEQACGDCGRHTRACSASCQWEDWGACAGPDPAPDAGACDAGLPGPCGAGALRCVDGALRCAQVVRPAAEVCDGVDNDCDGVIDGSGICAPDAGPDAGPEGRDGGLALPDGGGRQERPVVRARGAGCSAAGSSPALLALAAALLVRRRRR